MQITPIRKGASLETQDNISTGLGRIKGGQVGLSGGQDDAYLQAALAGIRIQL